MEINGIAQTEKKIDKLPLIPIVLNISVRKWKRIPIINPINILKYCFFVLDFLIDNEQPNITIVSKISGKERR